MDIDLEIAYAGVAVGKTAAVRDIGPTGVFVPHPAPLPVGTAVALRAGGATGQGRVERVVESADAAVAGMRIAFSDANAAALFGVANADLPAGAAVPAPAAVPEPITDPEHSGRRGKRRRH